MKCHREEMVIWIQRGVCYSEIQVPCIHYTKATHRATKASSDITVALYQMQKPNLSRTDTVVASHNGNLRTQLGFIGTRYRNSSFPLEVTLVS